MTEPIYDKLEESSYDRIPKDQGVYANEAPKSGYEDKVTKTDDRPAVTPVYPELHSRHSHIMAPSGDLYASVMKRPS